MKKTYLVILVLVLSSAVLIFSSCESDPILEPQQDGGEDKGSYANSNFIEIPPTVSGAPNASAKGASDDDNPQRF